MSYIETIINKALEGRMSIQEIPTLNMINGYSEPPISRGVKHHIIELYDLISYLAKEVEILISKNNQ